MATSSAAIRNGVRSTSKGGLTYDWNPNSTYVRNPPYFAGMGLAARAGDRHQGRAHSRPLSRFDHHRPHLARRRDQARQPRRPLPDRARRRRSRFQFLRRAARQSRSDGARHLRQYPDQEPDGARGRGRRHDPLPVGRAHARSTTPPCATATRACRSSSSPARNTAPAPRATGRRRARGCSASAP